MTLAERLINEGLDKGKKEGKKEGREEGEFIGKIQFIQQLMGLPPYPKEYFKDMTLDNIKKMFQILEQQWICFQSQKEK